MTKILFNIPIEYKTKLEKIAAMQTIETGEQYSITRLIVEALENEFNLKDESE